MKMKIERKNKDESTKFYSLIPGQLFEYAGMLMIKMAMAGDKEHNAFNIRDNNTTLMGPHSQVLPLEATLTVEE